MADQEHAEGRPADAGDDAVFAGDEAIGRDLAAVDWASTPLGPQGTWAQSLRTARAWLAPSDEQPQKRRSSSSDPSRNRATRLR